MKALIVYANPSPASLSARALKVAEEQLKTSGHEVVVRDLYALKFNPVLTAEDQQANQAGKLPADILEEQKWVSWADVIYFIHPIWWTGLPAIMKGYMDRVLLYGYAYSFGKEGLIGHLKGKKVVVLNNHGNPKEVYEGGMYDALKLTSDEGIYRFCGMEVVEHRFFPSASSAGEEQKLAYLAEIKELTLKHFGS